MALRDSLRRSRAAPAPPKSAAKAQGRRVPQPGAEHYLALLPTYWAKARPTEVINGFAQRVRADCPPEDIKNILLPALPGASLGTTGVQVNRLRAALERVARE